MHERLLAGLDYLGAVTTLLQRVRRAHPTFGSYQAAELQFWWSVPRSTDTLGQLFWFDDEGRPEAAVIVTDFGDGSSALYEDPTMVVIVMPDASSAWVAHVVGRGLSHIGSFGIETVEIEVDRADGLMQELLAGHGFGVKGKGLDECWLAAADRPAVSSVSDGYSLHSRRDTMHRPHHMVRTGREDVERRLQQTSLYRSDLDLVILDGAGQVAAYGLFWYDPETGTGVVEPMRTIDNHQRRGLARHVLTTGVDLLARAGAERISIAYSPENLASSRLYLSVGFEPHRGTDVLVRRKSNDSA